MQKKALGKGLGALLGSSTDSLGKDKKVQDQAGVIEIDINKIEPNINQPRKNFDEENLIELSESIKNYGIIQPLIVKEEEGYYTIIAGERRWRAARIAKLDKIPVIVKEYNDTELIQIALIENIQRQDLNPIEEAVCYDKLAKEYFFSQEDIAKKLGKKRNLISTYMNLLNLDARVQNFIAEMKLTASHGKVLLSVPDPEKQFYFAELTIEDDLSIRELEFVIKQSLEKEQEKKESIITEKNIEKEVSTIDEAFKVQLRAIEQQLKSVLGTKVNIRNNKNKGKIEIEYYSPEELDRILQFIKNK